MTANDGLQIGRLIDNEGFTDKRKKIVQFLSVKPPLSVTQKSCIRKIVISQFFNQDSFHFNHSTASQFSEITVFHTCHYAK